MRTQIVLLSLAAAFLTSNSPVLATDRLVPSQMVRGTLKAGEFSHLRSGSAFLETGTKRFFIDSIDAVRFTQVVR